MSFSGENYKKIKESYIGKSQAAKEYALQKTKELCLIFDDINQINRKLTNTQHQIFEATFSLKGKEREAKIESIKNENIMLQKQLSDCLVNHGFSSDYLDPVFECDFCHDEGQINGKMCACMKQKLIKAEILSSGIGNLMEQQSFENFNPEYQKADPIAYDRCKKNLNMCKKYVQSFDGKSSNLLFLGKTGLGKTHLSTAIAKEIINKGYSVIYITTQNMIEAFENHRFNRESSASVDRYFSCDLLIIDDLGTEVSNQFTISVIYNLIDTRNNTNKSTIINTNLSNDEIKSRYTDRVASRLMGTYQPLLFLGNDIRYVKLNMQ